MINYDHKNNQMMLNCDGDECTTMQILDGDFKYCIKEAKAAGWKIVKKPDRFHCYCSKECKNDFIKNNTA